MFYYSIEELKRKYQSVTYTCAKYRLLVSFLHGCSDRRKGHFQGTSGPIGPGIGWARYTGLDARLQVPGHEYDNIFLLEEVISVLVGKIS